MVRLADEARDCVVFLGYPNPKNERDDIIPVGTGFLIHAEGQGSYLVTAQHVARDISASPFGIRFNRRDGSYGVDTIDQSNWMHHESADVSILKYTPPDWADYKLFSSGSFATPFKRQTKDFGAGDIVYVVGLFKLLHGEQKMLPVVHTGNLALMAGNEPIPVIDQHGKRSNQFGYLVESSAVSGASGSPVFIRRTIRSKALDERAGSAPLRVSIPGSAWLLGVWISSWKLDPEGLQTAQSSQNLSTPFGIGVVVPSDRIEEILKASHSEISQPHVHNASNTVIYVPTSLATDRVLGEASAPPHGDWTNSPLAAYRPKREEK